MKFYGKAESVATRIIEQFQNGSFPKALSLVFIRRHDDVPCRSWSWCNQLLTALSGFDDARIYKNWQRAGRQVRKGEKSFLILEPCRKNVTDDKTGEERMITYGFRAGARFGLEQTDVVDESLWAKAGKRDEKADQYLDTLSFVDVARHWGLTVRSYNCRNGAALGKYRRGQSIAIGVENIAVWAHELIHAADDRLGELKERGQHWRSETVAELGSAVLLSCIGQDHEADLGGCWKYITSYAKANGKQPIQACLTVVSRVCKAVALILETADELAQPSVESEAA